MTTAGNTISGSIANFRRFAGNNRKNNPKELDFIAAAFDESLLRRLKALQQPSLSLSWFSSAVHLLSFAHSEARALISFLKADGDGSIIGWYLDDSLKILDICNSITSDVDRLRHRRLTVNYAIHLLQDPSLEKSLRARDLLSNWRRSGSAAKGTDDVEALIADLAATLRKTAAGKISAVGKLVRRTVRAVSVLTVFVAATLISALRDSSEIGSLRIRAPAEFSWSSVFNELESTAMDQKKPLLVEVADVEACAKDALNAMDNAGLKEAAAKLERRLEPLAVGLDELTAAVNGMFRTVTEIRTSIVDTLRAESHVQQLTKSKTKANRVVPAVCSS